MKKKKQKTKAERCFDVTMRSFDSAEVCELVGIFILCFLEKLINKKDCGLYRDDGLLILRNLNGQQIDRMCKIIIKIFKDISFTIDVEMNVKTVDFLDITFNLNNGTYRLYKKPNDLLVYISESSNHPPQIISRLPKIINERLFRNSSNEEVFNSSKYQYEKTLRDSGYTNFKLKFKKTSNNHTKRNRQSNITGFNPHFSRAVSQILEKGFSNYYVTTSHPPTNFTKYLIRTQWHSKRSSHHQIT